MSLLAEKYVEIRSESPRPVNRSRTMNADLCLLFTSVFARFTVRN